MPIFPHTVQVPAGSDMFDQGVSLAGRKVAANPTSSGLIASLTISSPGSFTLMPTITTSGPGSGATFTPSAEALNAVVVGIGTGYAAGDTITLTGGTFATASVITVTNTQLISTAVNAAGSGYHTNNTITLAGGTSSASAIITVTSTKLISAVLGNAGSGYQVSDTITLTGGIASSQAILTINSVSIVGLSLLTAGTGYAVNDTITLAGGTHSVAAIITVLSVSSGAIVTFSITTPGVYTVVASTYTQGSTPGSGMNATFNIGSYGVSAFNVSTPGSYTLEANTLNQGTTSGVGVGATFNTALYGVLTNSVLSGGVFTVNPSSFTQSSSSGAGTAATFNTIVMGINVVTATPTTAGSYTVLPANPVAQGSSSGSGADATINITWGILSIAVGGSGGTLYDSSSAIVFSGAGLIINPVAVIVLTNTGNNAYVPITMSGLPTNSSGQGIYTVTCNPGQDCRWFVDQSSKTQSGFVVTMVPTSGGSTISAGSIDVQISA